MEKVFRQTGSNNLKSRILEALARDGPSPNSAFTVSAFKTDRKPTKHTGSLAALPRERSQQKRTSILELNPPRPDRSIKKSLSFREPIKKLLLTSEDPGLFKLDPSRCSRRPAGRVCAFAGNTSSGPFKTYNEDRISMIAQFSKKGSPQPAFFAIYDGHGGCSCADFLKDNLHQLFAREPDFTRDPAKALYGAILKAESLFLEYARQNMDISGSCCLVVVVLEDRAIVANVGDSRAVYSESLGATCVPLTVDHKPGAQH
jgi:serine/threonine protein phosphatase PrpC